MSTNPEQLPSQGELGPEVAERAGERLDELEKSAERNVENSVENAERQAERARVEALETAISVEKGSAEKKRPNEHTPVHRERISKAEQQHEFKQRMNSIQKNMSSSSRAFSKIIHSPAVEKTSDVVGATVARPNAILAGSISAFILTTALYLIAKNVGYDLSGFETIGAFILGWIIGMLYDYLRMMITGHAS